ncbi:hypothetical protein ERJ75_001050200 [Trypanosoma vivax]|nr:hypothetical protein ERJ75_001050200 [Trypanosoma vivax]
MSRDIDAELREIQRDLQSVVDRMRAPDAPDAQRLQATARDLQSVVDQLGRRPISKAQVEECAREGAVGYRPTAGGRKLKCQAQGHC